MTRDVLLIPLEEIEQQFRTNDRQDVKIVAPERLRDAQCNDLRKRNKRVKFEQALPGDKWTHSPGTAPNFVCESREFTCEAGVQPAGLFAVSAANERADQDSHVHLGHGEIYFSTHSIRAHYRSSHDNKLLSVGLDHGGILIFAPGVEHSVLLGGLTLILEAPAVVDDKKAVVF